MAERAPLKTHVPLGLGSHKNSLEFAALSAGDYGGELSSEGACLDVPVRRAPTARDIG